MAFFIHYSNKYINFKDSITFEGNNIIPCLCHLIYFEKISSYLWYPRGNDKTTKIKSLQHLLTEIIWHTGNTVENDIFSIYESLLSKFGYELLKEEFPKEKFNSELIDVVEEKIEYLRQDALSQMPIEYPGEDILDQYNDEFDSWDNETDGTWRENIE